MKVYCGRNSRGVWKASLDETKMDNFDDVFESEVGAIHNDKVYMIRTYHGFYYNFASEINPICNMTKYVRQIFHSASAAKKHYIWIERTVGERRAG